MVWCASARRCGGRAGLYCDAKCEGARSNDAARGRENEIVLLNVANLLQRLKAVDLDCRARRDI